MSNSKPNFRCEPLLTGDSLLFVQAVHVGGHSAGPGDLPRQCVGHAGQGAHRRPVDGHSGHRAPAAHRDEGGGVGRQAGLEGCALGWRETENGHGQTLLPPVSG